ncbi:2-oxoglutarate/malate translocase OMT [Cryptosporidium felis]|nr:2-oxoglutarate/malate translocase OMT [Cryptosporidium felis]
MAIRSILTCKWLGPFIKGGISGSIATMIVQPIDIVKVNMQLLSFEGPLDSNPVTIAKEIIARNGFRGLYKGLDAALIRQMTYSTSRLGLFRILCDAYKDAFFASKGPYLPLRIKAIFGLLSGGIASFICNPTDLALVRLQTNSILPSSQQKSYKNVFQTLRYIIKEEGFLSMWKGSTPTVIRAMSINVGMLASYDHFKEVLVRISRLGEASLEIKLFSCLLSGVVATLVSLPFDTIKIHIQREKQERELLHSEEQQSFLNEYKIADCSSPDDYTALYGLAQQEILSRLPLRARTEM